MERYWYQDVLIYLSGFCCLLVAVFVKKARQQEMAKQGGGSRNLYNPLLQYILVNNVCTILAANVFDRLLRSEGIKFCKRVNVSPVCVWRKAILLALKDAQFWLAFFFLVEIFSVLKKNPFTTGCRNFDAHTRLIVYTTLLTLAVLANGIFMTLTVFSKGKRPDMEPYAQYLVCVGAFVIAAAIVFHVFRASKAAISSLRRRSALKKLVGKLMFLPIIVMILNLKVLIPMNQVWFTIISSQGIFLSLYTLFLSKDARKLLTDCCICKTLNASPGAISLSQPAFDTEPSDEEYGHQDEEIVEGEATSLDPSDGSYTALG